MVCLNVFVIINLDEILGFKRNILYATLHFFIWTDTKSANLFYPSSRTFDLSLISPIFLASFSRFFKIFGVRIGYHLKKFCIHHHLYLAHRNLFLLRWHIRKPFNFYQLLQSLATSYRKQQLYLLVFPFFFSFLDIGFFAVE